MSTSIGFVIPQFEDEQAEERWWRKLQHSARRYDAWYRKWLRQDTIRRNRERRKHRVALRRRKRGLA